MGGMGGWGEGGSGGWGGVGDGGWGGGGDGTDFRTLYLKIKTSYKTVKLMPFL